MVEARPPEGDALLDLDYQEDSRAWKVMLDDGTQCTARFLITAIGVLSASVLPRIPGIGDFKGQSCHTHNWPKEKVSFAGKRVAVIGTGATGIQAITEIAKVAGHLTVYQRTAQWSAPLHNSKITPEEMAQIEALGGWEKLMETLKKRLEEQQKRHQGGSKWIGTAGTSPFGAYGYNPEGVRIGQDKSRNRSAVKVWDQREYRNLDDNVQLGTRNIKVALRRLRKFARQGAAEELDLDNTIHATAANAGMLDIKMVPERHNKAKVLLLMDVGGSMDDHVKQVEQLFTAARSEFKKLFGD